MTLIQLAINTWFVLSLMAIGLWLETINGIHGWADKCLTPIPLGLAGLFAIPFLG